MHGRECILFVMVFTEGMRDSVRWPTFLGRDLRLDPEASGISLRCLCHVGSSTALAARILTSRNKRLFRRGLNSAALTPGRSFAEFVRVNGIQVRQSTSITRSSRARNLVGWVKPPQRRIPFTPPPVRCAAQDKAWQMVREPH